MEIDYNIPDRSRGDYYCTLCDARVNCEAMWDLHKNGKRHIKNTKKAPGELPSKVKSVLIDEPPLIYEILRDEPGPLVGLDYFCETRRGDSRIEPFYSCYLCQGTYTSSTVLEHLLSLKHRVSYLRQVEPEEIKFVEALNLPDRQFESLVVEKCQVKERKLGRGKIEVKVEKTHGVAMIDGLLIEAPTSSFPPPPVVPPMRRNFVKSSSATREQPKKWEQHLSKKSNMPVALEYETQNSSTSEKHESFKSFTSRNHESFNSRKRPFPLEKQHSPENRYSFPRRHDSHIPRQYNHSPSKNYGASGPKGPYISKRDHYKPITEFKMEPSVPKRRRHDSPLEDPSVSSRSTNSDSNASSKLDIDEYLATTDASTISQHVAAIVEDVENTIVKHGLGRFHTPIQSEIAAKCFSLKCSSLMQSTYDKAPPSEKKILRRKIWIKSEELKKRRH